MIMLPALMVGAQLTVMIADGVPNFSVEPSCRAVATGLGGVKQDLQVCLEDEKGAKDQLVKEWGQFTGEDKTRCTRMATRGGSPTYTEVLVCLEMARDARKLPKQDYGQR
jgi:hypothetical protein